MRPSLSFMSGCSQQDGRLVSEKAFPRDLPPTEECCRVANRVGPWAASLRAMVTGGQDSGARASFRFCLEAEAVVFVLCRHPGLEFGTAHSDYIQLYGRSIESLSDSLGIIQTTA